MFATRRCDRARRRSVHASAIAAVERACEPLEPRLCLHGDPQFDGLFHADVNFQPAGTTTPADYLPDTGAVYADRGNGYSYGWNADNSANTRIRNSILSPDARYDTLIHLQKTSTSMKWEIGVPGGDYSVHIVSGDAEFFDGDFRLNAENQLVVYGKPTSASRWVEGTKTVTVTDGRLTISTASGAVNDKMCFIDIQQLPSVPIVSVSAPDASASENLDVGAFQFNRTGDVSQDLAVRYLVTGRATADDDYVALSGTIVIPAGASSAPLVVTPIDDARLEPAEDVTVSLLPSDFDPDAYATQKLARSASVWIIDNETSSTFQPYLGAPIRFSATVQAEDFDQGPSGQVYKDSTPGNVAGQWYRFSNADIEPTTDVGGGFAVTHLTKDEWFKYTINAPVTGIYRIETRVASATSGGKVHVSFDGTGGTGQFTLPYTGGNQKWTTIVKTGVSLSAGMHTMKFYVDSAATSGAEVGSVNWIRVYRDTSGVAKFSWQQQAASLPLPREEMQSAVLNDRLYVFGGLYFTATAYPATTRVDMYDPVAKTWTRQADMPEPTTHAAVVAADGLAYFMGGYVGDHPGDATNHVWIYDPAANNWSAGPDLPAERGAGAAALVGREIHFVGGRNHDRTIDEADHWALNLDDLASGWQSRAPLPSGRNHFAAVGLGGAMYTIGGQVLEEGDSINISEVDRYDPTTDVWSRVADLPLPLSHVNQSTMVYNGKIVTVGGELAHNVPAAEVLMYDPAQDLWSIAGLLPAPRRALAAGIANGRLVVSGGYNNGIEYGTTWVTTLGI